MPEPYITTDTDGTPLAAVIPDPDRPGLDRYYLLRERQPATGRATPLAAPAQPAPAD